ncbi:hypothetical protein WT83_19230 [Burkholderia territorii]|uniref:Uncharacterized protein n=1 Tax=Burkholderia territorii TaxID=1503055 RepID=A0A108EI68_9BURK|nr:hypothetical protein [Burkholderia territorii]KWN11726.1 hypothetical protein WT83_19230 [Burkholderia territorii]
MSTIITPIGDSRELAHAILEHLGGKRFLAMTGARDLLAIEAGLSFRLPSRLARDNITHVTIQIELKPSYSISFERVSVAERSIEQVRSLSGVTPDELQASFQEVTGLAPSLDVIT